MKKIVCILIICAGILIPGYASGINPKKYGQIMGPFIAGVAGFWLGACTNFANPILRKIPFLKIKSTDRKGQIVLKEARKSVISGGMSAVMLAVVAHCLLSVIRK